MSVSESNWRDCKVGNRPMVDIEPEEMKSIWAQLQAAQKMLDAYFEACRKSEDDY